MLCLSVIKVKPTPFLFLLFKSSGQKRKSCADALACAACAANELELCELAPDSEENQKVRVNSDSPRALGSKPAARFQSPPCLSCKDFRTVATFFSAGVRSKRAKSFSCSAAAMADGGDVTTAAAAATRATASLSPPCCLPPSSILCSCRSLCSLRLTCTFFPSLRITNAGNLKKSQANISSKF